MKKSEFIKLILWEIINPSILYLKRNRKYNIDNFTGLNLGCGIDNPSNWLGIDGGITHYLVKKFPLFLIKPFFKFFKMSAIYELEEYILKVKSVNLIHHELLYGIPFESNSIKYIYSSHFFEHLYYNDSQYLLSECYRVLKTNGILRIVVPSLDEEVKHIKKAINEYENGNYKPIQRYVTSNVYGYLNKYSNHRFMYNFEILKNLLLSIGFKDIKEFSFKSGNIVDVELLDTRKDSIFVEAKK